MTDLKDFELKMDKPPAVIIIVRHAARLDAADKQWHLNTPVPYDPPLTYGGWTQSRALGARIASVLQARERPDPILEEEPERPDTGHRHRRSSHSSHSSHGSIRHENRHAHHGKKHKIIIHTSPYLRCVQTSIAISAGIGQYYGTNLSRSSISAPTMNSPQLFPGLSKYDAEPTTFPTQIKLESKATPVRQIQVIKAIHKTLLRIDAFLGEWQNPEYFQSITPPPESRMMVVNAKAELMRRSDYVEPTHAPGPSRTGNFPGGWGNGSVHSDTVADSDDDDSLMDMSQVDDTLPIRARSYSSNAGTGNKTANGKAKELNSSSTLRVIAHRPYKPPKPTYAVSPNEPIPTGYVAHARDACVETDFQWDSMRPPQNWGDGGEYGEEWPRMHNRFRNGLHKMISWYQHHDPVQETHHDSASEGYTDTVLILVTHGAGCNALIGAMTDQPVLMDVAMASLTMAVRRDITGSSSPVSHSSSDSSQSTTALNIADTYEVKLIASTEHLRAGSNPLAIPSLSTPRLSLSTPPPPPAYNFRQKYGSTTSYASSLTTAVDGSFTIGDGRSGSLYRSTSVATPRAGGARGFSANVKPVFNMRSGSGGLWSKPTRRGSASTSDASEDIFPDFGDGGERRGSATSSNFGPKRADTGNSCPSIAPSQDDEAVMEPDDLAPLPAETGRRKSQLGLWGDGGAPILNERDVSRTGTGAGFNFNVERDFSGKPKRRWTIDETRE
ncbi:MAG: hypothetical protein M1834_009594 [Cirrosporium novae-zelandiae]|nr:MAG: hypothetical protein M1834_009594 [Cirrosporium novae-zelandiae]